MIKLTIAVLVFQICWILFSCSGFHLGSTAMADDGVQGSANSAVLNIPSRAVECT